jgi:hypothetical protein
MSGVFDPLDTGNIAESIGRALVDSEPQRMDQLAPFRGAGVYAIYYAGSAAPYELLGKANRESLNVPIYVGKASPKGARKGNIDVASGQGTALYDRLSKDHQRSIEQATNLDVEDFWVKWLAVEPHWVTVGENLMIARFAPVWNGIVDGFGNHAPGSGRERGKLSRWDTLHPGRKARDRTTGVEKLWADTYAPRDESVDGIQDDVREYLRARL